MVDYDDILIRYSFDWLSDWSSWRFVSAILACETWIKIVACNLESSGAKQHH